MRQTKQKHASEILEEGKKEIRTNIYEYFCTINERVKNFPYFNNLWVFFFFFKFSGYVVFKKLEKDLGKYLGTTEG